MKFTTIVLASVLTLPLLFLAAPSFAASAHNIQAGTHTTNVYDTATTEAMKQQR